jgi:hypothetical protein
MLGMLLFIFTQCPRDRSTRSAAVIADEERSGFFVSSQITLIGSFGKFAGDRLPGRAEIVGHREIRLEVVEAIAALRDERSADQRIWSAYAVLTYASSRTPARR